MSPRFAVAGMGLWTPGYPTLAAWLSDQKDPALPAPTGNLLEKHSRRRASELTKALADVYAETLAQAQLEAAAVAAVFGSALGEAATMIGLLDQMWRGSGALSPMRFAASVHNAASGVVSISTKNTGFTTALGADHDTPAMALYEAMAFAQTEDTSVVIACGDEAAPANLVSDDAGWHSLSVAIAIVPSAHAAATLPRISAPMLQAATLAPADLPGGLARHPQAGLLDLIDALARGRTGSVRLDRGRGRGLCVQIERPEH